MGQRSLYFINMFLLSIVPEFIYYNIAIESKEKSQFYPRQIRTYEPLFENTRWHTLCSLSLSKDRADIVQVAIHKCIAIVCSVAAKKHCAVCNREMEMAVKTINIRRENNIHEAMNLQQCKPQ